MRGPRIIQAMSPEAAVLYQFTCYWRASVLGPVPFGQRERVRVEMEYIFEPDSDKATFQVWEQISMLCMWNNFPFDPEEWEVVYLGCVNAN